MYFCGRRRARKSSSKGRGLQLVLAITLLSAASFACTPETPQSGPPRTAALPDVARLVCSEEGSRVGTPQVRPQPDGIHLVVENRLDTDPGFAVEHEGGGGVGENAPPGETTHVTTLPPGTLRAGCFYPPEEPDGSEPDLRELEVTDPEGLYVPYRLDCNDRPAVTGTNGHAQSAGGVRDIVAATHERLRDSLKPGDIVEPAGYPEGEERAVRVVRDGRVVATVTYRSAGNGRWAEDAVSRCEGF